MSSKLSAASFRSQPAEKPGRRDQPGGQSGIVPQRRERLVQRLAGLGIDGIDRRPVDGDFKDLAAPFRTHR